MSLSLRQAMGLVTTALGRQRLGAAMRGVLAPALRPVGWLHRRTLARRVRLVAVTGSVGKTTTVRMLLAAFGLPMTETLRLGSNGMWSVPRRLLEIGPGATRAVVEIGIDRPGLMDRQAVTVAPDIAVVTSVAGEHLETMGSLETIEREKARLLAALRSGGVAVLNGDDPRVGAMAGLAPGPVWTYGFGAHNDVRALDVTIDWPRGMRFTALVRGEPVPVAIPLLGRHMVLPALAALTVAAIEGLPLAKAAADLADAQPMRGRLEVVPLPSGVTCLLDHQKNSAESLAAAVALAAEVPGRRILVTAPLREGSAGAGPALSEAAEHIARSFSQVIAIGSEVEDLITALLNAGFAPDRIQRAAPGAKDALDRLRLLLQPGDLVLFKARIAWKLDRLMLALQGHTVACDLAYCGLLQLPCAQCSSLGVARTGRFG